ncbi:hypothetical protein E2493_03240 [Sphingomonas parva]|uniref:Mannose-6-phosphate isomerase n=1 Tax=Sphingomonas parva TaxID=2555898 RepID=A0A4Y8ZWK8_9SPHN|nr:class I mannose-6-phosphate isomerase [Sphingomonas parva]TFI59857.1 hypothetical protein E2493_03240 [Sphingomonas parva]
MKLKTHQVEKPWGRTELPPIFGETGGRRIGEIWFDAPDHDPLPLLVKYIFTSENLSIQVHPDDEQARTRGLVQGKSECWYILDAEPGATLGIGLRAETSPEALRAAALDGSIESMIDWKPVQAGDFFFVPAGTVHAIGAGISLLEFQQNADVTYRLYDYGRPRELHLADGIAVSMPAPYPEHLARRSALGDAVLVDGPHFILCRATSTQAVPERLAGRERWVMPLEGSARSASEEAGPGECLLLAPGAPLALEAGAIALVGAAGRL